MNTTTHPSSSFISGQFLSNHSGSSWIVKDKFNNTTLCKVDLAADGDIDQAISSNLKAFQEFKKASREERSIALSALHDSIQHDRESWSELIAREAGKPLSYARGEVNRAMQTLAISAEEAKRFGGEVIPMDCGNAIGREAYTKFFPKGPVLGISPFNFPLNLAMHKLGPAIAAGCSITLKPSPYAPLSLLKLASAIQKLEEDSLIPKGLVNIICCDNERAARLLASEVYKVFSFTGSPQVGWDLKAQAGKKSVLLELGGNAACIVDETAELDKVIPTLTQGAFLYSGQICISTQRVFFQREIFDSACKRFIQATKQLQAGDPMDLKTTVGPLIDAAHLDRIDEWVRKAVESGAKILCGGEVLNREQLLYAPTILTNVPKNCQVVSEEVFGPVVVVESYDDFVEAIERVNDSKYGLQAGLFTRYIDRVKLAFEHIDVGGLMINQVPGFRIDHMPYGGVKDSGLGREGIRYAMEEMSESRLLVY
jgi:glyceraldehyde-3-phosphate dehydrogenase (NADP+)